MKKQFILTAALCVMLALGGCAVTDFSGSSNNSQSDAPTKYTVTFKQDGQADVVREVEAGKGVTNIPTVRQKTGYTVAWEEVDLSAVNENMVVEAVEIPNEYTITYDVNGGDALENATQTVTYDAAYTLVTPTKEDYGFQGWSYGEELYTVMTGEAWNIADDVTLVAQWNDERPPVYVTFVQYSRPERTALLKKGETLSEDEIPEPLYVKGYSFDQDNWYADAACTTVFDFSKPVQTSVTVYAKKTPNTYTVTYDLNYENAPTMSALTVTYDAAYTLAQAPARDGYNFLGWKAYNENGDEVQLWNPWATEGNVTVKAQWEEIIPETYTLNFIYNGSAYTSITLNVGETLAQADIPTLPTADRGYNVVGWCIDEACENQADFATIASSKTLYAKQNANIYQITYSVENATLEGGSTQAVTFGKAYQLKTPVYNVAGFDFVQWVADETPIPMQGTWDIDNDITLTPVWQDNRVSYTVTFMRGNTKLGDLSVKDGEVVSAADIPTITQKTGYTVDTQNWYVDAVCTTVADFSKAVTSSFTVYVKESANTYTITYDVNGGSLPSGAQNTFTVTYGERVSLAQPTKTGYSFGGWSYTDASGQQVKVKDGDVWNVPNDVKLIAKWIENKEWTNNY